MKYIPMALLGAILASGLVVMSFVDLPHYTHPKEYVPTSAYEIKTVVFEPRGELLEKSPGYVGAGATSVQGEYYSARAKWFRDNPEWEFISEAANGQEWFLTVRKKQ